MTGTPLFRWSAAAALLLHAGLLLASDGVHGGGDLKPHLRLIQLMAESPDIRSTYAPAYHVVGALVVPLSGLAAYPEWFALVSAGLLILAFRFFQRATGLPDACSALFALSPYLFVLTRCLPKVEVAGYAICLLGLALLLTRRHVGLAACVVGAFLVHTAAALLLGLVGGIVALFRRDARALVALGVGALLALPLFVLHLVDGCTLGQAFLFSRDDYLRAAPRAYDAAQWRRLLLLANPLALLAAGFGARALWTRHRAVAVVCVAIVAIYLNELWLAPFGMRTTLDLVRGLTVLAIPVALAGGLAVATSPRLAVALVGASGALALLAALLVAPNTCVSRPVDVTVIAGFDVDRCMFRWRRSAPRSERLERGQVGPDALVDRAAPLQRAAQQDDRLGDLPANGVGTRDPA